MMRYLAIGALILALIGGGWGWYQSSVAAQATQRAETAENALAVSTQRRKDAIASQAIADATATAAQERAESLTAALLSIQQRDTSNDACKLPDDLLSDLRGLREAGTGSRLP